MSQHSLSIPVVTPFPWPVMLQYLQSRLIAESEQITGSHYLRQHQISQITIAYDAQNQHLTASYDPQTISPAELKQRCRQLFAPELSTTEIYQQLQPLLQIDKSFLGFRPVGCWDSFELCIRTIIGQQVTVKAAQTLMQRLRTRCGDITPAAVAQADLQHIGMPGRRVQTLKALASAVADQQLDLQQSWPELRQQLLEIPGIGPWTVDYLGIRLGRDADAFPASDIGLLRSSGCTTAAELLQMAEAWRPYRAYAACYLWAGGTNTA